MMVVRLDVGLRRRQNLLRSGQKELSDREVAKTLTQWGRGGIVGGVLLVVVCKHTGWLEKPVVVGRRAYVPGPLRDIYSPITAQSKVCWQHH